MRVAIVRAAVAASRRQHRCLADPPCWSLTGVMAKLPRPVPLTTGVTTPEPTSGPTDAGSFAQLRSPV